MCVINSRGRIKTFNDVLRHYIYLIPCFDISYNEVWQLYMFDSAGHQYFLVPRGKSNIFSYTDNSMFRFDLFRQIWLGKCIECAPVDMHISGIVENINNTIRYLIMNMGIHVWEISYVIINLTLTWISFAWYMQYKWSVDVSWLVPRN